MNNERLNVMVETNIPPDSLFMPLGYDPDATGDITLRHYRRFFTDELENIKEVMPIASPFD